MSKVTIIEARNLQVDLETKMCDIRSLISNLITQSRDVIAPNPSSEGSPEVAGYKEVVRADPKANLKLGALDELYARLDYLTTQRNAIEVALRAFESTQKLEI